MHFAKACIFVFAALRSASAAGYVIDHWGTREGLPQNSVLRVVQTRDRYLWLATFGGLVRFDGLKFTTFDSGVTPGLKSNRILDLAEDRDGTLWIATQESGLVAFRNGKFVTYGAKDGLPSDYVRAVAADQSGGVWAATWKGLVHIQGANLHVIGPAEGLSGTDVLAVFAGKSGRVWAGSNSGTFLIKDHRAIQVLPDRGSVLHEDSDGNLWIGASQRLRVLDSAGNEVDSRPIPVQGRVRSFYESPDRTFWVATETGLWRRSRTANGETEWSVSGSDVGLSDESVRSIAEDSEGNLWVGTNARGLNRLKKRRVLIAGVAPSLPTSNYVPVIEDHTGAMWFGLTCGGLVRYSKGEHRVFTERDGLGGDCVWSLLEDRDHALWIGSRNGLTRFQGGRFFTYNSTNSGLSDNWVTALHQDRRGTLWVGTGNGLFRFQNGVFSAYHKSDGLVEDDVRFIVEDPAGALWIGTTGGMSRFHENKFTNYTVESGLPSRFVRAIHLDGDGTIWIGTYGGGLARFHQGSFAVFNSTNGLSENVVSRIIEDESGYFWLSGNRGIHRVSKAELHAFADRKARTYTSLTYDRGDGMLSSEANGGGSPAGWKSRDGRLWFPTQQGVAVISPKEIIANQHPPAVVIEQVLVNREPVDAASAITIPPGPGELEIHYTGLSFAAPDRVRFRYRLEGVDSEWVDADRRRTAYYTRLPAGVFRFIVGAANGDGVWNENGAALNVEVVPPFWNTWMFRLLAALFVLTGIALLFRWRVRGLERAGRQQAAFSRRLIESQEAERERIAAELHDSIGQTLAIIRNRALVSLHEPANQRRAVEQLDEIANAAEHALDEVRSIAYDLRPYHLDRLGLAKAIEVMLSKAAGSGEIQFTAEVAAVDGVFPPKAEINIYRIVQEAVSNIVKHSAATEASVQAHPCRTSVEIVVKDNGVGFSPEATRSGYGLGLNGIAERTRLLGGDLTIDSAPGQGTAVRVAIPRAEKAYEAAAS